VREGLETTANGLHTRQCDLWGAAVVATGCVRKECLERDSGGGAKVLLDYFGRMGLNPPVGAGPPHRHGRRQPHFITGRERKHRQRTGCAGAVKQAVGKTRRPQRTHKGGSRGLRATDVAKGPERGGGEGVALTTRMQSHLWGEGYHIQVGHGRAHHNFLHIPLCVDDGVPAQAFGTTQQQSQETLDPYT
jgi:hypothetical protein